jgi:pentatricopeptide repeat protein
MEQMLESQVRPNALTYQCVVYARAATGKPNEAEDLLRRMYSAYLQGDDKVRPELHTLRRSFLPGPSRVGPRRRSERKKS